MDLSHEEFRKLFDQEKLAIGVDRLRIQKFYSNPFILSRLAYHKKPRLHNKIANWLNGLSVPIMIASFVVGFVYSWWALPCIFVVGIIFNRQGYAYRKKAIMELSLQDEKAYEQMIDDGIINLRSE